MPARIATAKSISFALLFAATVTPAPASTPESWAKLDKATEAACLASAKLAGVAIGPALRYSDQLAMEARIVEGSWPQPHMKGAKARMLCLYNRKTKRAEVQELPVPPAPPVVVRDIMWRAEAIGANGVVAGSEVTMMLGGDGKIGGKSGCNGYSANYQLSGEALKVYPPMIGTRMACTPAVMVQEAAYLKLVENAASAAPQSDGTLLLTSSGGETVRFVRK